MNFRAISSRIIVFIIPMVLGLAFMSLCAVNIGAAKAAEAAEVAEVAEAAKVAKARTFPEKQIRFIVPATPGATTDTLARLTTQKVSLQWSQPVVIDNRPGAGSITGTDLIKKANPDGYTIGILYTSHTANASLQKLPYDPINDFTHLTMLTSAPLLLVVGPNLQVTHLNELIGLARTRTLSYGSPGVGSGGHLSGELFRMMTSLQFTHVPYRGAGPAAIDVAAGNLDFQFASQITSQAFLQNGRLRVLAVTSLKRASSLPQVPSMNESGMVGFEVLNWFGISAPAHLSKPVTESLYKAFAQSLYAPEVQEKLKAEGSELSGSSPTEFTAFLKKDLAKWAKVIKEAKISAL